MSVIIDNIFSDLRKTNKLPVIFTGSGFTKRYTTNDYRWEELLIKCISYYSTNPENQYKIYKEEVEYQLSDSNDYYSLNEKIGSLVSRDFNKSYYALEKKPFDVEDNSSPIKEYISILLKKYSIKPLLQEEIKLLKKLRRKMLTVVTTNYDTFIEDHIFPDHDKVISQKVFEVNELGTLFKIHGCVESPNSIIFTEKDYSNFNKKRMILSAKLINLFTSNPVIFMGYSISDKNVRDILFDIFSSLDDPEEIKLLEKRMIFIDYDKNYKEPEVKSYTIEKNDIQIRMTQIITNSYIPILENMAKLERSLSVKDLKIMKDLVYDIVESDDGTDAKVMNLTTSTQQESDKVVVVLTTMDKVQGLMQELPNLDTIMKDIVFNNLEGYDPEWILRNLVPILSRMNMTVPVNKYIKESGLDISEYSEVIQKWHELEPRDYLTKSMKKYPNKAINYSLMSYEELLSIDRAPSGKLIYMILKATNEVEYEELEDFIKANYTELYGMLPQQTYFRKLIYILDAKKNKAT